MLYGQELLNHINSQIEKYTTLGNWQLVDNYKAKKTILENKGFSQYGTINHINKTITKEVVWITDKAQNLFNGTTTNSTGQREFNSNINYWTGEQEETQIIQLNDLDFELEIINTLENENFKIESIISTHNNDKKFYYKVTLKDETVLYMDFYFNYFNIKGIKGIKKIKSLIDEVIEELEDKAKDNEYIMTIESGQY